MRQVTASYGNTLQEVLIANSLGFMAEDKRSRVRLVVNVIAEADGKSKLATSRQAELAALN